MKKSEHNALSLLILQKCAQEYFINSSNSRLEYFGGFPAINITTYLHTTGT